MDDDQTGTTCNRKLGRVRGRKRDRPGIASGAELRAVARNRWPFDHGTIQEATAGLEPAHEGFAEPGSGAYDCCTPSAGFRERVSTSALPGGPKNLDRPWEPGNGHDGNSIPPISVAFAPDSRKDCLPSGAISLLGDGAPDPAAKQPRARSLPRTKGPLLCKP